jgi:hypothetical protein
MTSLAADLPARAAPTRIDEELAYLQARVSVGEMLGDAGMGISAVYLAHLLRHVRTLSDNYRRLSDIEQRYEQAEADLEQAIVAARILKRRLDHASAALDEADGVIVDASTLAAHFDAGRIAEVRGRITAWRERATSLACARSAENST